MNVRVSCLVVTLFLLAWGRHAQAEAQSCTAVIGERHELNVSLSSPVSLCYPLNGSLQSEAIRVLVSSDNATSRHPLLVTVRQPVGVVSWAVPYTESGFSYNSVERTLCPQLNVNTESAVLLIDLSTSERTSVSVSMATSLVQPFKVTMNNSVTLQASPSAPSYLMYEALPTDSRVRVRFQSSDNTSHICAIASIQIAHCPVVELLDNPDHRGRYQTMRSIAAINTRVDITRGFFYMVVTVFPSDGNGGGCVFNEQGIGLDDSGDNYNPTPFSAEDRVKTVIVTVEPALSDSGYAIAVVVSAVVYFSFYVIALCWILVFDWWRYYTHYVFKQIAESATSEHEEEPISPQDENLSDKKTQPVRQDSSDEEEENYTAPPTQGGQDTPDFSLPSTVFQRGRAGHHHGNTPGKVVKRPSMLSVLRGTHLNLAIDEATPPSSQHTSPHGRRSRHNSENYPSLSPVTSPRVGGTRYLQSVRSLNPTASVAPLRFKRQKSVSESYATPTTHSLTPLGHHMIATSPVMSHDNHMLSLTSPAASHGSHMLRVRKPNNVSSPEGTDNGGVSITMDTIELESPVDMVTTEGGESIKRQQSYTAAVEEGQVREKEYYDFPINVSLAEVGDIDDSAFVQKKYNHYALYLLIVIIFYSIPAYQLVVTYQRLLTTSGNEDLCYYNSLCAHPWDVYPGLSLSAFNSIYSNIGFFVLGFLYILIAYRRRVMYRSFERINCSREREERVGIPQHFGIHYAIGLALMAEALMSVAYHICPSNTNYQFDTTFMYILAALGLHKLLENRSPDLEAGLHKIMLTLAAIIVVVVLGVLYSDSVVFWSLFFIIYIVVSLVFAVEAYYRWQLTHRSLRDLFTMYKREGVCPPKHIPKFVMAIITVLFNWIFGLGLIIIRPIDFGTVFLFILLGNFILYLLYYAITKAVYREVSSLRPLVFVILAVLFWIGAIVFYTRVETDWTVSPALSRDNNSECYLLGFYDAHDMWHFLSSFALFFSFLMLMTLDDKQEDKPRKTLRAF